MVNHEHLRTARKKDEKKDEKKERKEIMKHAIKSHLLPIDPPFTMAHPRPNTPFADQDVYMSRKRNQIIMWTGNIQKIRSSNYHLMQSMTAWRIFSARCIVLQR